jgi:hypothetical protein
VREPHRIGRIDIDHRHGLSGAGRVRIDHLYGFIAKILPQQCSLARAQSRLVGVKLIGVDGPLNDRLSEAIRRGNQHHVTEPGLRVQSEHDAAAGKIAAHHVLYTDGKRDVGVLKSLVHSIGDGAVIVQ